MRTLSNDTIKKVAKAIETTVRADVARGAALDLLIADGFDKVSDYVSPKSTGSTCEPDEWEALKGAVIMGFTKTVQALLDTPTKALDDVKKSDKRYWQQQVNARIADFKRQLAKREAAEERGASRTRTLAEWFTDFANDGEKKLRNAEECTFDILPVLQLVQEIKRLVK